MLFWSECHGVTSGSCAENAASVQVRVLPPKLSNITMGKNTYILAPPLSRTRENFSREFFLARRRRNKKSLTSRDVFFIAWFSSCSATERIWQMLLPACLPYGHTTATTQERNKTYIFEFSTLTHPHNELLRVHVCVSVLFLYPTRKRPELKRKGETSSL